MHMSEPSKPPTPLQGSPQRGPPPKGPPPGMSVSNIARGPPPRGPPPRGPPPGPPAGWIAPRGPPPRGPPPGSSTSQVMAKIDKLDSSGTDTSKPLPLGVNDVYSGSIVPPMSRPVPVYGYLNVKCIIFFPANLNLGLLEKNKTSCRIMLGSQRFSTKALLGTGKGPLWNESHKFEISNEKELFLELIDVSYDGIEKVIGRKTINIVEWIASGNFQGEISMLDSYGLCIGKVMVAAVFEKSTLTQIESTRLPINALSMSSSGFASKETVQYPNNLEFTDEEIKEAFLAFDLDKNNFVGADEIMHILVNIGEQATDDEIDEMIRMVDRDGDGQICFEEFYFMATQGKKPPIGLYVPKYNTVSKAFRDSETPLNVRNDSATAANVVQKRNSKKILLDQFSRSNNIRPDSIKNGYKRLLAMNKGSNDMVDYKELCKILEVDPGPEIESIFKLFQNDRTKQVDSKEFLISLANYSGASKEDKIKFAFMMFDKEGNGIITKEELIRILKANHMAVSNEEVLRKSDTIMNHADKNGTGVVTFEQFTNVSKKFPNILFPTAVK